MFSTSGIFDKTDIKQLCLLEGKITTHDYYISEENTALSSISGVHLSAVTSVQTEDSFKAHCFALSLFYKHHNVSDI